jgi:hypothetical protein
MLFATKIKLLNATQVVLAIALLYIAYKTVIKSIYVKSYGRLSNLSQEFRDQKLDIVYTWVDMCEEEWITKETENSGKPLSHIQDTLDQCSDYSYKEIDYSILHTLKYTKAVIGTIYVITDKQTPNLLVDPTNTNVTKVDDKTFTIDGVTIKIVYHTDIMPAKFLPCYNSNYIEAFMHRISGLSDWFIYMNDDYFINTPVTHDWFFLKDNVSRFMADKMHVMPTILFDSPIGKLKPLIFKDSFSFTVWNSHKLYNSIEEKNFMVRSSFLHTPKIINKHYMEQLFNEYYSYIQDTYSQYRTDTNINTTFIYEIAMIDNELAFYSDDYDHSYLSYTSYDHLNQAQYKYIDTMNPDCFVINETNHNPGDIQSELTAKNLAIWLTDRL